MHPDWTYYFWTDADNLELLNRHYPEYVELYNSYNGWAHRVQKADFIRYFILHRYGGVYVDLDFEALRPLDALLEVCSPTFFFFFLDFLIYSFELEF